MRPAALIGRRHPDHFDRAAAIAGGPSALAQTIDHLGMRASGHGPGAVRHRQRRGSHPVGGDH